MIYLSRGYLEYISPCFIVTPWDILRYYMIINWGYKKVGFHGIHPWNHGINEIHLVPGRWLTYPSEKYEFVSCDDYSQYLYILYYIILYYIILYYIILYIIYILYYILYIILYIYIYIYIWKNMFQTTNQSYYTHYISPFFMGNPGDNLKSPLISGWITGCIPTSSHSSPLYIPKFPWSSIHSQSIPSCPISVG